MADIEAPEAEIDIKEQINTEIKKLDFQTKVKAGAINHYLEKKKALDDELDLKIKELTLLYEGKSAPLYKATSEIINGVRKANEEELTGVKELLTDEQKGKLQELDQEPIKEYWLTCFKNCYLVKNEIKQKDSDILKSLKSIEYHPHDANHFEVVFHFAPNDYFTNESLKKEIFVVDDEPVKGVGSTIHWKEGKNITKQTVKKTQQNKKTGAKRVVTKEVDDESFFNLFGSVNLENEDELQKLDDEEAAKLEERMNLDYDICRNIVDEIIPYSLEYFLNVKQEEDYGDEDMEDMDEECDSADHKNDDDDDEEDSKPHVHQKKEKGGDKQKAKKSQDSASGATDGAQKDEKAPECQQQ